MSRNFDRESPILNLPIAESCEGCGACCREQESPPSYIAILNGLYDDDGDDGDRVRALPQDARDELLDYIASRQRGAPHPNNGVCLWFDEQTRQCRNYDLRPEICREVVKVGDEHCQRWRERYAETIAETT